MNNNKNDIPQAQTPCKMRINNDDNGHALGRGRDDPLLSFAQLDMEIL